MTMSTGVWGPDGRTAAVSVTFDHLGEASELQAGELPVDAEIGDHHSVVTDLPRVLGMLAERSVRTTFYVEAWNCEHYPEALHSIVEAGHTLGWHAWWNEPIYRTTPGELSAIMTKSLAAFDAVGLRLVGARPPGGLLGPHSLRVFQDSGFEFLSLAGAAYGLKDGTPMLPYAWQNIDGCYYLAQFSGLRVPAGDWPVGTRGLLAAHTAYVERTVAAGGFTSFIFHVPWTDTPERVQVIGELIDQLTADERIWFAPSEQIADWIRQHPEDYPQVEHTDEPPAW
jgi:peptidoglycan/xylan/chitin deacetylase (PgdA/CDA1 family)